MPCDQLKCLISTWFCGHPMRFSFSFQSTLLLISATGLIFAISASAPVYADSPRQIVSSASQSLSSHTDQLIQLVQVYLQNAGRWSPVPQGADMQLCQSLQEFQKKVKMLRGDSSRSYKTVQSDLQNLQFQSQLVEQLLNKQVSSPIVGTAWLQIRNDVMSIGQAMTLPMGAMDADAYYEGRSISNGFSQNGLVQNGLVQNGLVQNGLVQNGLVQNGLVQNGLVQNGLVASPFAGNVLPNGMPVGGVSPFGGVSPYGYNPTNINITENSTFDSRPSFQGSFNNFGAAPNGFGYGNSFAGSANNFGGQNFAGNQSSNLSNVSSSLSNADSQSERFVKQLSTFLQMRGQWPPATGTPGMVLCQNVQAFQQQLRKLNGDVKNGQSYAMLQTEMQQLGAVSQSIDQQLMQTGVTADVTARWNEVRTSMNSAYQLFYSAGSNGYMWMR